ncbi:hypothetical protein NLU13_8290 [Sarocladium strictum]|uniref:Protein kinase domain-containing protein n=1 Tax=Sarocladium strictum TaxID=5046 RepID=A0AA39GBD8_SARSR|nr:hypothetical protein NLU13_8290 [Sarocladium strictum]
MDSFDRQVQGFRQDLTRGLDFHKRENNQPTEFDRQRNFHAIQSALLRGDKTVGLLNRDTPDFSDPQLDNLLRFDKGDDPASATNKAFPGKQPRSHSPLQEGETAHTKLKDLVHPKTQYDGVRFHFDSIIGRGGNGMVLAMTAEFFDGDKRKLAVKIPRRQGNEAGLCAERKWHQQYQGATHTVQHVDISEIVRSKKKGGDDQTHPDDTVPFDEQALGILVLERADHGNLWTFMNSVVRQKVQIPDQVLWSLWLCIVKMVASVDYQPGSNAAKDRDFEAFLKSAEHNPSSITDYLRDWAISHHVHFDYEFQNVLLAEDDGGQHGLHPLLKLHDFDDTWSKDMKKAWGKNGWSEENYWHMRHPLCD